VKQRLLIVIRGAVQGVGFRPFIYNLASSMKLTGWVENNVQGVFIEAEGDTDLLKSFLLRIEKEKPAHSFIQSFESSYLDPIGYSIFEIRKSSDSGIPSALVQPDIATCPDCLSEIFDSSNRRYRYPFTNCTHCGPRFTIIRKLPYDRPNTSMNIFPMCTDCMKEYESPADRRFHAQPNACPKCGPKLSLRNPKGEVLAEREDALQFAVGAIKKGSIVAVKGIGGFHLIADARDAGIVQELRKRKHREEKPFAIMYPSLAAIRGDCIVLPEEERLLISSECPIVLLRKNDRCSIAQSIAPNNPYLGVILPYAPLHHILMHDLESPVVATSGNISDEPICIDENEAIRRLNGIADLFLVHDRPIVRHMDDSIVRLMGGREMVMRRARGYAPLPVSIRGIKAQMLAVGAHLKNTVALSSGENVFISQHIGDLETEESYAAFRKVIDDLQSLYASYPEKVICDLHPDYLSAKFARENAKSLQMVQHHYAHIASCMAENQLEGCALGVAWDGTGYGLDQTVWGGEFLLIRKNEFERAGHLRTFRLPGGEAAIKEPRRAAIGLLYEIFGDNLFNQKNNFLEESFSKSEVKIIHQMLKKKINSPITSSAGRLFDAVAAMINLRTVVRFEGQAAMELEFSLDETTDPGSYIFSIDKENCIREVNWEPMVKAILEDVRQGIRVSMISQKFHNTLVEMIVAMAKECGEKRIILSGGCFQNKYLTERSINRLREEGFVPYWHQRVPSNDGGIALGQIAAAQWTDK
jgi:hydrogenase maturation protein HypF